MRRILLTTVVRSVSLTVAALAVGGVVSAWVICPVEVPVVRPADAVAGTATGLAAVLVALLVSFWLAGRGAARLSEHVAALRSRAERLGGGHPPAVPLASGVAELDELDATLARGAQQGARRLAAERDFAADASHQLRTPLTALLMRLEEIAATRDLAVVAEEAHIAIGQVERLSRVVDELMSRTRSGVEANPVVSLDSVLASLQREWQPAFAAARRSVHVQGERGLRVRATPVALGQILTTLLENSLAYGKGTVEVVGRRAGPSVVVEVRDSGEGVSAAIAPHIFERSVSSSGSGLGLSLARDLAEAAGGRLELASARPPVFALFLSESAD